MLRGFQREGEGVRLRGERERAVVGSEGGAPPPPASAPAAELEDGLPAKPARKHIKKAYLKAL